MRLFNLKKLSVKRKIVEQRMLQQLLKKNEYNNKYKCNKKLYLCACNGCNPDTTSTVESN